MQVGTRNQMLGCFHCAAEKCQALVLAVVSNPRLIPHLLKSVIFSAEVTLNW